ncbi:MAG: insulinase family protein [Bacteriovorax sp.]|nr:insulinase family protein [Bacteriovorax sp.]
MKNLIKVFAAGPLLIWSLTIYAKEPGSDPYQAIEYIKLDNGVSVYLAPSEETNLTEIRLDVGVGWEAENKSNWGVSHLLEHVLFRDKQLKEEMSYLQIIKEAGGRANGQTDSRLTSYYGSIPSSKSKWLLDTFSKMLLHPNMTNENVQKEKSTVELEIGRPGPVTQALGFNPFDKFYPSYLKSSSFWETEFKISNDNLFSKSEEQLSNQKLTLVQINDHYNNYYYPSNMKLFVAGKFTKKEIMDTIIMTWGTLKPRVGLSLKPVKKAEPRLEPYIHTDVTQENNSVYIGTKAWNFTNQDQEILSSYSNYLAHRLMKEIRNLKGQAYTAHAENYFHKDYGYTYVGFQTPKENLDSNL